MTYLLANTSFLECRKDGVWVLGKKMPFGWRLLPRWLCGCQQERKNTKLKPNTEIRHVKDLRCYCGSETAWWGKGWKQPFLPGFACAVPCSPTDFLPWVLALVSDYALPLFLEGLGWASSAHQEYRPLASFSRVCLLPVSWIIPVYLLCVVSEKGLYGLGKWVTKALSFCFGVLSY